MNRVLSDLALNNIPITIKTKLLLVIMLLGILLTALLAHFGLFVLKEDYENLYLRHTISITKLEKLKEIYRVNIVESASDLAQDLITRSDADEIFSLAKKLIDNTILEYQEEEQKIQSSPIVEYLQSFFPMLSSTDKSSYQVLIDRITSRSDRVNRLLISSEIDLKALLNESRSIEIFIAQLLDLHLKSATEEKARNSALFRVLEGTITASSLFVLLTAIFLFVVITRNIERLQKELENEVNIKTKALTTLNEDLEKKIAKEVKSSQEKDRIMYQQSRLAAMGEMISNIAHQWRQPLNALTVLIQSFQTKMMTQTLEKEFVATQTKEGLRIALQMSQTIDSFKNFFKPLKEKGLFGLSACVLSTVDLIRSYYQQNGITITINIKDDICLDGYSNEFAQVLLNLLSNAFGALSGVEYREILIIVQMNKEVNIRVIDSGGGVDEAVLDKIFDPYFTTKHPSSGTGIGLYMSRQIVVQMGGNITAKNIYHKLSGTSLKRCAMFTISLPKSKRRECATGSDQKQESFICGGRSGCKEPNCADFA